MNCRIPEWCFSVDYTAMRKWKWLFVNGCNSKRPISNATEYYKLVSKWEKCVNVLGHHFEK